MDHYRAAWSSARAHMRGADDSLVRVSPLLDLVPNWPTVIEQDVAEEHVRELRRHETTGRPLGAERFVRKLERLVGRVLRPAKPGRKPKAAK